jgi:hypothetical protein
VQIYKLVDMQNIIIGTNKRALYLHKGPSELRWSMMRNVKHVNVKTKFIRQHRDDDMLVFEFEHCAIRFYLDTMRADMVIVHNGYVRIIFLSKSYI